MKPACCGATGDEVAVFVEEEDEAVVVDAPVAVAADAAADSKSAAAEATGVCRGKSAPALVGAAAIGSSVGAGVVTALDVEVGPAGGAGSGT
jgi:hypothetical protein